LVILWKQTHSSRPGPPPVPALKKRCAHFSKQLCDADPSPCPRSGGPLPIIAFIDQAAVIETILTHLGLWPAHAQGPPKAAAYPLLLPLLSSSPVSAFCPPWVPPRVQHSALMEDLGYPCELIDGDQPVFRFIIHKTR
jgi:hypothetical protein